MGNLRNAERFERRVVAENWEGIRLLLKDDDTGFYFHITAIYPGTETCIWYKNLLEFSPKVLYFLDRRDRHLLQAKTDLELACIFNPSLSGKEVHDEDGAFPLEAEDGAFPL